MKFGTAILSTLFASARAADGTAAADPKPFRLRGEKVAESAALGLGLFFDARVGRAKVLERLFGAISQLVPEVTLVVSEDGVSIQTMDSSHVALVAVHLNPGGFEEWNSRRPHPQSGVDWPLAFGVDAAKMANVLEAGAGDDDAVTLEFSLHSDGDRLNLMFGSDQFTTEYGVEVMDLESETLEIPEVEPLCTVSMPSSKFKRIIEHFHDFGETLALSCGEWGVEFRAKGDGVYGDVLIKQHYADEGDSVSIRRGEENIKQEFALRYLNSFTGAASLGPRVILKMTPDSPLEVEYPIEDWGRPEDWGGDWADYGYIRYYLAPMSDEQEEFSY